MEACEQLEREPTFAVDVALKLHAQLAQLVAAHAGLVGANGKRVFAVARQAHALGGCGHFKVLDQLDAMLGAKRRIETSVRLIGRQHDSLHFKYRELGVLLDQFSSLAFGNPVFLLV